MFGNHLVVARYLFISAVLAGMCAGAANAQPFANGEKIISLHNSQGESFVIGSITFQQRDTKTHYQIAFDDSVFNDEFLSMRPFKCIRQPAGKMLCHLVYPYQQKGYISADDWLDLEYDLLFLHKSQQEYGINAWNGLYYKLTPTADGFTGQLMEVDLNVLAAPPEADVIRPITLDMLHDADPDVHMFPKLTIE